MPIVAQGVVNTTALIVPNVLVSVVEPRVQLISGVPTGRVGIVGTAVWGPVGVAQLVSTYADYQRYFGPLQARARDMGTMVAMAHQQGANDFRCVRVTDGTDTAATVAVGTDGITFTSRYSGTLGNKIRVTLGAGSRPSTWMVRVELAEAGYVPEVFDNIGGSGVTGNALWVAIADAVNNGQFGTRSGSEIVIATAGAGTGAPTAGTSTLAGGTDGVTGVADEDLVGVDTEPKSGMYALSRAGCDIVLLAEAVDAATWAAQVAWAKREGCMILLQGPAGDTIANAVTTKQTAGIDDPAAKVLFGDWAYWLDNVSGLPERMVSPQGVVAGRYATLAPHLSGLNRPIQGLVATQRTRQRRPYSDADLTALGQARIDVVTNPVPGGNYFAMRFGSNASTNPTVDTDAHTRLTNYIARSLDEGIGRFIGLPHSDEVRRQAKVTLDAFFQAMADQGQVEAFSVQCDEANNPPNRRGLGYLQADCAVRYFGVIKYLLVNLEGGSTVQVRDVSTRLAAAA